MPFKNLPTVTADGILVVEALIDLPTDALTGDIRYVDAEAKIYIYDGSNWTEVSGGGGGTGTIVGPVSSTNNAIARWSGSGGDTLKDTSPATVSDTGEITSGSLTASRVLVAGASKQIQSSTVTSTELGYVSGVTSAIQTQLNAKLPSASTTDNLPEGSTNKYYTDERAQDAVGSILADTSTVDLTYDDASPSVSANVKDDSLTNAHINTGAAIDWTKVSKSGSNLTDLSTRSHTDLTDIGTNTHAQIDTALATAAAHEANTSNPHSVTKTQVGLGNVDNTSDATKNAAPATLTNKDIDGGTASNSSRITVPKAAKATLDGLTRKEGTLVYASDLDTLYADNGTVLTPVGAGSSGEINAIANANDAYSGWSSTGAGMTVATTSTASELPLAGILPTGIKVTNVSGTSDETRFDFEIPVGLRNKKLKLQWDQLIESGYGSTDTTVDLKSYSDSGRTTSETIYPLTTDDTSANTYVPAASGRFVTYFDTDDRQYYRGVLKRAAGTKWVVLQSVIVGPDIQPQGLSSRSPSVAGFIQPFAGSTAPQGWVLADGSSYAQATYPDLYAAIGSTWNTATDTTTGSAYSSPGAGNFRVPDLRGVFVRGVGTASGLSAVTLGGYQADMVGPHTHGITYSNAAGTGVNVSRGTNASDTAGVTQTNGTAETRPRNVGVNYIIKVWNDTSANLAQNDPVFVSHDGTSVIYGPQGAVIPTTTPAGTFQTYQLVGAFSGVQSTDSFALEIQLGGTGGWMPAAAGTGVESLRYDGTNYIGADIEWNGADYYMTRGKYRQGTTTAWSGLAAGTRWRVRRYAAGQAVGFGEVNPGVSSGLVGSAGLKGKTNGVSIPAGYVGERIAAACNSGTGTAAADTDVDVTNMSITLTPGVWLLGYDLCAEITNASASATTLYGRTRITTSANVAIAGTEAAFGGRVAATGAAADILAFCASRSTVVNVSSSTTYKVRVASSRVNTIGTVVVRSDSVTGNLTDPDNASTIWAVRIA